MSRRRLRVLVLSRSYPSDLFPTMGLWVGRPTVLLGERCDVRVVSPVPWCPPLPAGALFDKYARFRRLPKHEVRDGVAVDRPRFLVGPGTSTYPLEAASYYRAVVRRVERLHRAAPFDLIHAHFVYPDGAAAGRIARRLGIPLVLTEHAPWQPWLDRLGIRRQALAAARSAAALLAVSTSVRETMEAELGPDASVDVVPVGVDGDAFPLGDQSEHHQGQILFVGFVNYNKGVDVLLEAVAQLRADGRAVRLVLAGGGNYRRTLQQAAELRRYATELELDDTVEFLGQVSPMEIARLMRESAVIVLPSRAESFGAVLVEALASGTPVVATRCGGPEDIVDPTVGELVPAGDARALAAALDSVLRRSFDPAELRASALERFSWHSIVDRVVSCYEAVTTDAGTAGATSRSCLQSATDKSTFDATSCTTVAIDSPRAP